MKRFESMFLLTPLMLVALTGCETTAVVEVDNISAPFARMELTFES
jgi:hypothetical protein